MISTVKCASCDGSGRVEYAPTPPTRLASWADELETYPPCQVLSQRRDACCLNNGHRGLHTSQDGRYWE